MHLRTFAAVALLLVCASLPRLAPAACDENQPAAALSACLGGALRAQDDAINALYRQRMARLNAGDQTRLRDEQRTWLRQRSAQCRLDARETNRERWFRAIERDPIKIVCVIQFTDARLASLAGSGDEDLTDWSPAGAAPVPEEIARSTQNDPYVGLAPTAVSKGRLYFEVMVNQAAVAEKGDATLFIGIQDALGGGGLGPLVHARRNQPVSMQPMSDGSLVVDSSGYQHIGIAVDLDSGKLYYSRNGAWLDGLPGSNQGLDVRLGRAYRAAVTSSVPLTALIERGAVQINFGTRTFKFPPPQGYAPFHRSATAALSVPTAASDLVVAPGRSVAGTTIGDWTHRFWQRLKALGPDQDPGRDPSGARCAIAQSGPVWFLAGSYEGGSITRKCKIPRDKHVLVSLVSVMANPSRGAGETCGRLRNAVSGYMNSASGLFMTVDQTPVADLTAHREASLACFSFTDASGDTYSPSASDGYWIMLKPMAPGTHIVHYGGRVDADGFTQDIAYHLIVE